jgi:hypothetical protein
VNQEGFVKALVLDEAPLTMDMLIALGPHGFPGSEAERCILRDLMINKILKARVDEPEQFTEKIPLWLPRSP